MAILQIQSGPSQSAQLLATSLGVGTNSLGQLISQAANLSLAATERQAQQERDLLRVTKEIEDEDYRQQLFERDVFESDRAFGRGVFESDRTFGRGVFESDRNFFRRSAVEDRNYLMDLAQHEETVQMNRARREEAVFEMEMAKKKFERDEDRWEEGAKTREWLKQQTDDDLADYTTIEGILQNGTVNSDGSVTYKDVSTDPNTGEAMEVDRTVSQDQMTRMVDAIDSPEMRESIGRDIGKVIPGFNYGKKATSTSQDDIQKRIDTLNKEERDIIGDMADIDPESDGHRRLSDRLRTIDQERNTLRDRMTGTTQGQQYGPPPPPAGTAAPAAPAASGASAAPAAPGAPGAPAAPAAPAMAELPPIPGTQADLQSRTESIRKDLETGNIDQATAEQQIRQMRVDWETAKKQLNQRGNPEIGDALKTFPGFDFIDSIVAADVDKLSKLQVEFAEAPEDTFGDMVGAPVAFPGAPLVGTKTKASSNLEAKRKSIRKKIQKEVDNLWSDLNVPVGPEKSSVKDQLANKFQTKIESKEDIVKAIMAAIELEANRATMEEKFARQQRIENFAKKL